MMARVALGLGLWLCPIRCELLGDRRVEIHFQLTSHTHTLSPSPSLIPSPTNRYGDNGEGISGYADFHPDDETTTDMYDNPTFPNSTLSADGYMDVQAHPMDDVDA